MRLARTLCLALISAFSFMQTYCQNLPGQNSTIELKLRSQQETAPGAGRFHRLTRTENWDLKQTAVIVCDVWDSHHCVNAVRRVVEVAPRINRFVGELRERGVTVIHAPSGCMDFYRDHPARHHALKIPKASSIPADIGQWCDQIVRRH